MNLKPIISKAILGSIILFIIIGSGIVSMLSFILMYGYDYFSCLVLLFHFISYLFEY